VLDDADGEASPDDDTSRDEAAWLEGGVDCHMHLRADEDGEVTSKERDAVLDALDRAGLESGCVLASGYKTPADCGEHPCDGQRAKTVADNDDVLGAAGESERLRPFCGVPLGYEWSHEEVERCADAGAAGIKLHPVSQQVSVRAEGVADSLAAVLETAAGADVPVLIHVDMSSAEEIQALFELAEGAPDARVIVAHQLGPSMAMLAQAPPNVVTEVSGLVMIDAEMRASLVPLWRAIGVERILLGSDYPDLEPSAHVDALAEMPLDDDERHQIVAGNARRVLD